MVLLVVGQAILAALRSAAEGPGAQDSSAGPARLDGGALTLKAREQAAGVVISLQDSMAIEYAGGPVCYSVELKNGRRIQPRAAITLGSRDRLVVTASSAELENRSSNANLKPRRQEWRRGTQSACATA